MNHSKGLAFLAAVSGISLFAAEAPASAGLMNDWLRKEWPEAKAWDVGGQFRVRYEVREDAGSFPNRDFLEGVANSNDYYLFRTKAHIGWKSDWVGAFVEGRDSHDASDKRTAKETDTFDLHQAYIFLGNTKEFPISLKIGRQELVYGDERYIGASDWSNTGRSFDAAKLRFENEVFWIDAFAGRVVIPRDEHFNVANDYDWFSGVYGSTKKLMPWQETEAFFISRNVGAGSPTAVAPGFGGPASRDIYTVGTRWKSLPGKFGNWDYTFEAAGQFGGIGRGPARLDHEAFAVNGTGGYTLKDIFGSPRLTLGYDFGSGDNNSGDTKNGTFEPLLGTNHRLYGLMDLAGLRNMHIPRAGASIKPVKDLTVSMEWLGFWLADTSDFLYPESAGPRNANGYGINPSFNSYVGNEIDLNASWRVTPWAQLQGGYGHFFVGDYIRQSAAAGGRGTDDADWVYLQVTVSF